MKNRGSAFAEAARVVFHGPGLLAANLIALPVLFVGFWGWLYLPVSNIPLVAGSVVLLLLLVAALLLLMIWSYCAYYTAHHPLRAVSSEGLHLPRTSIPRRSLAALPWVFVWFVVFGALLTAVNSLSAYTLDWAKPVASWLTMASQKPLSFYTVNAVFVGVLDAVRWFFLPGILLASFAGFATAALRRGRVRLWQRVALRVLRRPLYWLGCLFAAVAGLWIPQALIGWTPGIEGVPMATASMILRFGAGIVLAILAWLFVLSLVARLTKQPSENFIVVAGKTRPGPA